MKIHELWYSIDESAKKRRYQRPVATLNEFGASKQYLKIGLIGFKDVKVTVRQ